MDDRVGTLSLRVRTDLDGRDDELRDVAERFTRDVIERVSMLLDAHAPGRLVMLQHLPVHWTMSEHASTSTDRLRAEVERAADELAAQIETSLPSADREPSPDAVAVVFAGEAAWIASALRARARGTIAWFHKAALRSEPLERMIAEPTLAIEVLVALAADDDALLEILAVAPPPVIGRLEVAICRDHDDVTMLPEDAAIVLALVERIATWPWVDAPIRRLAAHVHALVAARGQPALPAARIAGWARRALAIATPMRATAASSDHHAPPPVMPATVVAGRSPHVITDFAGLFYLVPAILELGLAEALWQACLPEGAVIANALRVLLHDHDPVLDVIAGDPVAIPAIDDGQVTEVVAAALGALVVSLPRGGRAELPAAHVQLVDHPCGRLLVVTAHDAPFVWFAQPVNRPADALAAIAALFAHWPKAGPLFGAPALIELDRTGRIRHAREVPPPPLLVDAPSPAAVALGSVAVGAPCQLLASRIGDRVRDASVWAAERLARPARITRTGDLIEVWQPADAVDIPLRAAGIDRDPGLVPWLGCTVRLRFED